MRRSLLTMFLLVLLFINFAPAMASAKDDASASAKEAKAEPDILAPRPDLTLWTIIVFVVLFAVLYRLAWKPMLTGLQKREHNLRAVVEDAQKAREETQRLREDIQAERNKIEDMRRDILQKAQADAQRTADEITAKAKAEMQAERDRLRRDMENAHDQALQDLYAQTVDLAALVSSKAMRREMTPDDHRRFMDEALADIRQAGNGQKTTVGV
jgi:F-type H+-transporting ATPase subunit b